MRNDEPDLIELDLHGLGALCSMPKKKARKQLKEAAPLLEPQTQDPELERNTQTTSATEPEPEPEPEPECEAYPTPELPFLLPASAVELLDRAKSRWQDLPAAADDDCYRTQGREAIIARVAANDPTETKVDWSYKNVTEAEVQALLAALPGNTCVRMLDFKGNPDLTDATARVALFMLPECSVLQASFEYCDGIVGEQHREGVSKVLQAEINTVLIANILEAVRNDEPDLIELDLHGLGLRDMHMEQVADALAQNTRVQTLRVGGNAELTDAGLRILLAVLGECLSVTHIDLSSQRLINTTLTDEGVVGLLQVIPISAVSQVNLQFCDKVSWELKSAIAVAIDARLQQEEEDRLAAKAAEAERIRLSTVCPDCELGGTGDFCAPHIRAMAQAELEAAKAAEEEALAETQTAEELVAAAKATLEREETEARAAAEVAQREEEEAHEAQERARQEKAEADAALELLELEDAEALAAEAEAKHKSVEVERAALALQEAKAMKKGKAKKQAVKEAMVELERVQAEADATREHAERERKEADQAKLRAERVSPAHQNATLVLSIVAALLIIASRRFMPPFVAG